MFAAGFQAMPHRFLKACSVALEAGVYTPFHVCIHGVHRYSSLCWPAVGNTRPANTIPDDKGIPQSNPKNAKPASFRVAGSFERTNTPYLLGPYIGGENPIRQIFSASSVSAIHLHAFSLMVSAL